MARHQEGHGLAQGALSGKVGEGRVDDEGLRLAVEGPPVLTEAGFGGQVQEGQGAPGLGHDPVQGLKGVLREAWGEGLPEEGPPEEAQGEGEHLVVQVPLLPRHSPKKAQASSSMASR